MSIPLSHLLGFAEDYKFIINAKHELILIRAYNDVSVANFFSGAAEKVKIILSNVEWLMPYVKVSKKWVWVVKTTNHLEKPRYIIFGL